MKVCIKCNLHQPISEFYKHKKSSDGHLNECKTCVKKRVREREERLRQDLEWVEKEKERHRLKYHRLGYKDKHKPTTEQKREIMKRYKAKYPEKEKARNNSQWLSPKTKGNHLHHWSYNKEHWKDVIEINEIDHNKIHRFLKYDRKTFYYKDLNGNLLDTKEKHLEYINKVLTL